MSADIGFSARYLILDVGYPMTREQLRRCIQAFENVVALVSMIQNMSRTSSLGIQLINASLQSICRLKSVDKCFPTVTVALKNILRFVTVNERIPTSDFMDVLNLAIQEALRDFQEMIVCVRSTGSAKDHSQPISLHLTLLTRRDGPLVQETLEAVFKSQPFEEVSTFQVLALADDGELMRPVCLGAAGGQVRLKRVPVASIDSLENVLKGVWFAPREAELKRLCLVLPAPVQDPLQEERELLCAASECLLDPSVLPVADRFLLWPPVPSESFLSPAGKAEVRLRVLARLSAYGLCEASTFGPPVRVAAAPSDFLEPAHFQRDHAQMFRELCCQLHDSDEYLIARMQEHDGDNLGGHFVLMAGEDCLLLRAIASAELLLPGAPENPNKCDLPRAQELQAAIRGSLDQLPTTQHFHARDFPSGLYRALVGHASFPVRRGASPATATAALSRTRGPSGNKGYTPKKQKAAASATQSSKGLTQLTLPAAFGKENVMAGASSACRPNPKDVDYGDPWGKSHKLGTGGHPALLDEPAPARKRRGTRGRGWNPPAARQIPALKLRQEPGRMDTVVIEDDDD